jgi:hypothetical protein
MLEPSLSAPVMDRSLGVATWDARGWLAGLVGCERGELTVLSVDQYGPAEKQVRYQRAGQAIARLVVAGPILAMGERQGRGQWHVTVRIGSGSDDVHSIDVPEADEIVY